MNKTRLEAFSDGVMAIIITIMVLELKPPHKANWHALTSLSATFLCYLLSFIYIGIYWGNHHHLLHTIKSVSPTIIWANMHLLFWLSIIPFTTAWMGDNCFTAFPVACYAVLLDLCGFSYTILQKAIENEHTFSPAMKIAMKKSTQKGIFSICAYTAAIPLAFVNTVISGSLFVLVAIVWLIPDKKIELALKEHE
jgi:uncharacterized membrane protein